MGGRIRASESEYGIKHPIIIPKTGHLSYFIVSERHLRNLHSGTQLTLCHLRQLYQIVGSRSVAIHLELVSDQTSNAFLAAFRRFCAPRGNCGTNFVGADREMRELCKLLQIQLADSWQILWHPKARTGILFHLVYLDSAEFGRLVLQKTNNTSDAFLEICDFRRNGNNLGTNRGMLKF